MDFPSSTRWGVLMEGVHSVVERGEIAPAVKWKFGQLSSLRCLFIFETELESIRRARMELA